MFLDCIQWHSKRFNGICRDLLVFSGILRDLMEFSGIRRDTMVFNVIRRDLMAFNGIRRDSMVFNGIRRDSMHYWLRPIKRGQFRFANFAPYLKGKCHFHFLVHSFALIPLVEIGEK